MSEFVDLDYWGKSINRLVRFSRDSMPLVLKNGGLDPRGNGAILSVLHEMEIELANYREGPTSPVIDSLGRRSELLIEFWMGQRKHLTPQAASEFTSIIEALDLAKG